jgi:Fe-S cluster assembly protein SufD
VTVTEVPNVAQAIETVESHLHPKPSFDLADHPVPTGREEVWRFTPLRRIKALLEAAPDTGVLTVAINAPEGVEVGELAARQSPRGTVLVPGDRLAALADSDVASARYVRIPADLELTEPVFIDLHGEDAQGRANLVTVLVAEPHSKATVVLRHTGSAQVLENVEIDVRPGASLTVVSLQDWADDTLHGGEHTARVGRDASYRHVNVSFGATSPACTPTSTTRAPAGGRNCTGCTSPTRASTSSTGCSSTTTRPTPTATSTIEVRCRARRPHGVGRGRLDPQDRREHRDV